MFMVLKRTTIFRKVLCALVGFFSVVAFSSVPFAEEASTDKSPEKTQSGAPPGKLERATKATGKGLKRAANATERGLKRAGKATGRGLKKGGQAIEKTFKGNEAGKEDSQQK